MKELQEELQRLKKEMPEGGAVRALKEEMGLLDTGATHAMRGKRHREIPRGEMVSVTLAGGETVRMCMNAQGTLIHDDPEVDPIVPVGRAIKELGCILKWDGDVCTFEHPVRGPLKVEVVRGCPEISKQDALDIILDLEGPANPESLKQVRAKEATSEVMWLERVLEDHPVFEDLPQHLKHRLLDTPATDLKPLGLNRRQRKRVQNGGAVVHLYAGPDVGFTLKRAVKEVGGDAATLLEYDTKRDSHEHDMLRQNGLFSGLLRLAFDGQMDAIVGGPNCRTRSVLLYAPRVGFPGPCRSRAHPWGYPNLSWRPRRRC